jgi:Natural resistance-associated macrophage protein
MLVVASAALGRDYHAVASAQDAARARRPLAGAAAADLFAAGLVTAALVALPVVMASTVYVIGAHFNWRRGLSERAGRAWRFCAILAASIRLALVVSVAKIPVIGMLVAASVTGGSEPHRPGGPSPPGRRSLDHVTAAHHPAASHRGWAVIVSSLGLLAILGAAVGTS